MNDDQRREWHEIASLPQVNGTLEPLLKTVDSLRSAWEDALQYYSAEELAEARNRRLRRHAVETGIIERLYELDWGTTEALVAEGLTSEVANRAGGVHEDTLLVIRSQYEALQYLAELAGNGRSLTVMTIRELHKIITRHQATYEARDQFGKIFQTPLHHGEWKTHDNHVTRPGGSILEYCPPIHVQSEMERLVRIYEEETDAHPLVRSAWLHHSFIQIHPFEDGNGRVARAITLLVLLRDRYAPLVVDRRQRETYIAALDTANDGDLGDLIRFFARLEIAALQSTLTQPVATAGHPDAASVVRAYASRLRQIHEATSNEKASGVKRVADDVAARITNYLEQQRQELQDSLRSIDPTAWAAVGYASPPDERARWWRRQIIHTARAIDFYTNLGDGTWWTRLQLETLGDRLRFLAAVQKVGHGDSGVLAVTVYAERVHPESDETSTTVEPESVLDLSPTDSVSLAYNDEPSERWPEVEELLQRKLREAVEYFVERLG
jgi:fido (protein-threonine AMPylation protein)